MSKKFIHDPMAVARSMVKKIFDNIGEGDIHGTSHAFQVENHARKAVREYSRARRLHADEQMAVWLAALLHDVDDDKIFPGNSSSLSNARYILDTIDFALPELVLEMIRLVSFSKNGNNDVTYDLVDCHGPHATSKNRPRWMYIPRDADRIEALGELGVARCIAYGSQVNRSLMSKPLPCEDTRDSLFRLAAKWHLSKYRCSSTIEYFVAGLIPRTISATGLNYFRHLFLARGEAIIQVCLLACRHQNLTINDIYKHLQDLNTPESLMAIALLKEEVQY